MEHSAAARGGVELPGLQPTKGHEGRQNGPSAPESEADTLCHPRSGTEQDSPHRLSELFSQGA